LNESILELIARMIEWCEPARDDSRADNRGDRTTGQRIATLHSQTGHFLPCLFWVSVRWSVSACFSSLLVGPATLASDLWEVAPGLPPSLCWRPH